LVLSRLGRCFEVDSFDLVELLFAGDKLHVEAADLSSQSGNLHYQPLLPVFLLIHLALRLNGFVLELGEQIEKTASAIRLRRQIFTQSVDLELEGENERGLQGIGALAMIADQPPEDFLGVVGIVEWAIR
jgi:hypothetical protein